MTETGTVLHPQTEGRRRDDPTAQTVRIVSSVRSADRIDAETPEVSVPSAGTVRRKDVTAIERIVSREETETATGTVNMGVTVIEMDASREGTGTVTDASREAIVIGMDVFKEGTGTVTDASREAIVIGMDAFKEATVIEMDAFREAIVIGTDVFREATVTEIATAGRDAGPERGAIAAAVIREAAAPAFRHQP